MINSYRIIPVYTGDVLGAASALYELGGMVVIHDPSGCNSTYNTHDETRWYEQDSLIFISGLSEVDAILGNDDKLIRDVIFAAEEYRPAFIALTNSPVPFLNGTDFPGIARLIEKRTGIPAFYVPANGTHDYSVGAGEAFLSLAKVLFGGRFAGVKTPDKEAGPSGRTRINLLGVTPLDFDAEGAVSSVRDKLSGFEILSCWSMGSTLSDLKRSCMADVNVVTSVTGLRAAQWMKTELGIPYVTGCPVGSFTNVLCEGIIKAAQAGPEQKTAEDALAGPRRKTTETAEEAPQEKTSGRKGSPAADRRGGTWLIGEPVMMMSLREHLRLSGTADPVVINPLETPCPGVNLMTSGEEDLQKLLSGAETVWCDPLYKPLLPKIGRAHV